MSDKQIMAGASITSKDDLLKKVSIDYMANSIKNPKPDMIARMRQLRMIRTIDVKQYASLKRNLPYLVCGIFNPPYRRTENFAYIQYYIIDIDHIGDKQCSVEEIKTELIKDPQVVMCFISPSEDGLKVLFHLSERCYDPAIFSIFYKAFARDFAKRHNIEQVIDAKTSDVARACFISIDTEIYYNPNADTVDMGSFLDADDTYSILQLRNEQTDDEKAEDGAASGEKEVEQEEENVKDPDSEVMFKIKSILNPSIKKKIEKNPVYVPEQLNEIIMDLKRYVEDTGLVIYEISNIQYGKKIKCKTNIRTAEVNVFYGKRGFSVVSSPRSGTSSELNQLLKDLIQNYIDEYYV